MCGIKLNICRFCLKTVCENKFQPVENVRKEMIENGLGILNLDLVQEPTVCLSCLECLREYQSFVSRCRDIEKHLTSFQKHVRIKTPAKLFDVIKFASHKKREKVIYKCEICDFTTNLKRNFTKHSLAFHRTPKEDKWIQCDICDFKTKYQKSYRRHKVGHKTSEEVDLFQCAFCVYQSKHKEDLKKHMNVHRSMVELQLYQCETCDFKTKCKATIHNHLLQHKLKGENTGVKDVENNLNINVSSQGLSEDKKIYKCNRCDFRTDSKNKFNKHEILHKELKDVSVHGCNKCEYVTTNRAHLKRHSLIHKHPDEITMYTCNVCDLKTKHKRSMQLHMLRHKDPTELEMFYCHICEHTTKRKGHLVKHMLVHRRPEDITFFSCHLCDYKVKMKLSLTKHLAREHKTTAETVIKDEFDEIKIETLTEDIVDVPNDLVEHKNQIKVEMILN